MIEEETFTHEEWLAKGKELFGEDVLLWKFECPVCRDIAAIGDFPKDKQDMAGTNCIGRALGVLSKDSGGNEKWQADGNRGCDWAAYGLFHGPVIITTKDPKKPMYAFRFAA